MNMEKMMKTARGLDTFLKIVRKITLIALIVMASLTALTLVVYAVPGLLDADALSRGGQLSVSLGSVHLVLADGVSPDLQQSMGMLVVQALLGLLTGGLLWYGMGQLRQILAPMTQGRPFDAAISGNVRRIAFTFLVYGIVANVVQLVIGLLLAGSLELYSLIDSGRVERMIIGADMDFTFVAVFFLLLLFSYVFQYGAELQKLSDETL